MKIKKVAVLGSGIMGSSIAAYIAGCGISVLLLDIVPKNSKNRNSLVINALEKISQKKSLFDEQDLKLIEIGNLEDDLEKLRNIDWILEAIIENIEIKHSLYNKISPYLKEHVIISSNTSTIPLKELCCNVPKNISNNLTITHFFNPPRYMKLLELVTHNNNSNLLIQSIKNFCDIKLGKIVIICNDTPGFIANRIGCFWLITALVESINFQMSIEDVDKIMSNRHIGIPKTGIFGLIDLIGLDTLMLIMQSLVNRLPKDDLLCQAFLNIPKIIQSMVADGYTGAKGLGGFYRKYETYHGLTKQVIDLSTGLYRPVNTKTSCDFYVKDLKYLFESNNKCGKFAWALWSKTLIYTSSLIPEISNNIHDIDIAMKIGYNWKYGPFELIDKLNFCKSNEKDRWFFNKLQNIEVAIPKILSFNKNMYQGTLFLTISGEYTKQDTVPDCWYLSEIITNKQPIVENISASLWDIGDGVVCFDFKTKSNVINYHLFQLLYDAINITEKYFKCMIIGNDKANFSVGADLLYLKNKSNSIKEIAKFIDYGQEILTKLKFSKFPTVAAWFGFAVGGGCEIALHCDAIQAHIETSSGLVEANVGLLPGWGGCKEMILRYLSANKPLEELFSNIMEAKISKSAKQLYKINILNQNDRITINRKRLLADAKALALELLVNYKSPDVQDNIKLPQNIQYNSTNLRGHNELIAKKLMNIFTNQNVKTEEDLLKLEKESFLELISSPQTISRISHMIDYGTKLNN